MSGGRSRSWLERLVHGRELGVDAEPSNVHAAPPPRSPETENAAEVVGVIGRAVLEPARRPGVSKRTSTRRAPTVRAAPRRRCLALVAPAVAADELHARAPNREVEDPRVRGVHEVETDDLPEGRLPENSVSR